QPDWVAPEVVPPFGGGLLQDRVVKPRRASRLPHQIVACTFKQLHAHFSLLGWVNGEALGTSPFTFIGGWLQLSQPQNVIFQLAQVVMLLVIGSRNKSGLSFVVLHDPIACIKEIAEKLKYS